MAATQAGAGKKLTMRFAAPAAAVLALGAGVLVTHGAASATTAQRNVSMRHSFAPSSVSIYPNSTVPADPSEDDSEAVELGVKFSVRTAGTLIAIKYYKSAANTGTHTATLWSKSGLKLATATFSGETATGWQTATLSRPVTLSPQTSYVASYHTNSGHYAEQEYAFGSAGVGNDYITATSGVYVYGRGAFPGDSWHRSGYFVDVEFSPTGDGSVPVGPPTSAPTSSTPKPAPTSSTPKPAPTSSTPKPAPTSSTPKPPPTSTTPTPAPTSSAPPSTGKMTVHPNAGVPAGTVLTPYTGPSTITVAGTVIDGKDIPHSLRIAAKNVVITRSAIHGKDDMGIQVDGSLTISQSTISGFDNGIGGDNFTASLLEVTKLLDDGFKLGDNVHVDKSWCHDLTPEAGAHADCGQMQSGVVNMSVTNSWFDGGSNSALFIAPDLGPSTSGPVTISGNVLGNGNYTLFCVDGNNGQYFVKNIAITNNQFLKASQYGPARVNVPVTASGNTWFGTNTAVSMN